MGKNAIQKANARIDQEITKEVDIAYAVLVWLLWNEYGWRKLRISRLFIVSQEVWTECADAGVKKSMVQMLDEETGLELQVPGMKPYTHYAYLNYDAWNKKPPTDMQLLAIRGQQKKWMPAMILASVCLSLYRKEGWGVERLSKFAGQFMQTKIENERYLKNLYNQIEENTDFTRDEIRRYGNH